MSCGPSGRGWRKSPCLLLSQEALTDPGQVDRASLLPRASLGMQRDRDPGISRCKGGAMGPICGGRYAIAWMQLPGPSVPPDWGGGPRMPAQAELKELQRRLQQQFAAQPRL